MIDVKEPSSFIPKLYRWLGKEKLAMSDLPPTIFRLFGEGLDLHKQLSSIPEQFRDKVIILTTADTPETVLSPTRSSFRIIQSSTVTTDLARENSSLLLNEGIKFGRENGLKYLFFLSSGFQRHLEMFYSMTQSAMEQFPDSDAYYFVLPETHENVSIAAHEQAKVLLRSDTRQFLKSFFPYETALTMRTSLFDFETNLSAKGTMGKMLESKIPLGGMEFMITLLSRYAEQKKSGASYSPKMIGITLPIPTRIESAHHFYQATDSHYSNSPSSLANDESLEVTSTKRKLERREATFQAACNVLRLNELDIQTLFRHTQIISGITEAFRFENNRSPRY